jgi:hypothetical protein
MATVSVQLVDLILDELDLNALVSERVDIDALAADLDIEAVINRVDLIALADKVIQGVDLPAIIRDSTNSMTAEVMTDVRTQGERADDLVAGMVDRMLGRGRDNRMLDGLRIHPRSGDDGTAGQQTTGATSEPVCRIVARDHLRRVSDRIAVGRDRPAAKVIAGHSVPNAGGVLAASGWVTQWSGIRTLFVL